MNTPRVNQWWNSYRSGAITAGEFKEVIQGMERELEEARDAAGRSLMVRRGSYHMMAINNLAVLVKLALEKLNAPAEVIGANGEGDTDAVLAFLEHLPTTSPTERFEWFAGMVADRARLDWLEDNPSSIDFYLRDNPHGEPTMKTWLVQSATLNTARPTLREAIDAAKAAANTP